MSNSSKSVESQMVVLLEMLHRYKEGQLTSHEVANYAIAVCNVIKRFPDQDFDESAMNEVLGILEAKQVKQRELVI